MYRGIQTSMPGKAPKRKWIGATMPNPIRKTMTSPMMAKKMFFGLMADFIFIFLLPKTRYAFNR